MKKMWMSFWKHYFLSHSPPTRRCSLFQRARGPAPSRPPGGRGNSAASAPTPHPRGRKSSHQNLSGSGGEEGGIISNKKSVDKIYKKLYGCSWSIMIKVVKIYFVHLFYFVIYFVCLFYFVIYFVYLFYFVIYFVY